MADRATHPGDTTRTALALARALTVAVRSWSLYPPDHPAVGVALGRFATACQAATSQGPLALAVTPTTLLVEGAPLDADLVVQEAAALLHDRDLLQIIFVMPPPETALRALLALLVLDREARRTRGGPEAIWAADGHPAVQLEQIDYQELLEREGDEGPARRDELWHSLVRSVISGRATIGEAEQQRLLEISRHLGAIGELTADCGAPFCTPDGAPLVTTQAATVLAVYRHIASTVAVLEPERAQEVLRTLAVAASSLEPAIGLELMRQQDAPDDPQPLMAALRQTFDDRQVAMLLARALSSHGQATGRLAQVLDTLAPDDDRRRRVLRMADQMLSEETFRSDQPVEDLRKSLEELLLKYDEKPFVSQEYQSSMDDAQVRAAEMALCDLPPEMSEWTKTLGHENVRQLSGQLLIDLLRIETDGERAAGVAHDMAVFADDLVLAGAYEEATRIVAALQDGREAKDAAAPDACAGAIRTCGHAAAFQEAVGVLGEMTDDEARGFGTLAVTIGPPATAALLRAFNTEDAGRAGERAARLIVRIGRGAIPTLADAAADHRWHVQRTVAQLLGQIGTADAVPPLQALLRQADVRVLRAAVSALAGIDDPAAARALHTVLRAVRGEARTSVIAVLVGLKDPRVVPMLLHILAESQPLGADHALVLETLGALAGLRDDRAVPSVARLVHARRWFAWFRTRRLRLTALRTLERIGSPAAADAFERAAREGGWGVRRLARQARLGDAS
ncbi:MAG: HEAT repeat domain-containing protein [Vicinamibacteria bacterium]